MDEKNRLRAEIKAQLRALGAPEHQARSLAACLRFMAHESYKNAQTIFAFASVRKEISTELVLASALRDGKRVALPRATAAGVLTFHAVRDIATDLALGRFGIQEPLETCAEVAASEADVILVPGVAFSVRGERLGQGGGYYDRYLAQPNVRATLCALAFEFQIVEQLPIEAHDRAVKAIFTEARTLEA